MAARSVEFTVESGGIALLPGEVYRLTVIEDHLEFARLTHTSWEVLADGPTLHPSKTVERPGSVRLSQDRSRFGRFVVLPEKE